MKNCSDCEHLRGSIKVREGVIFYSDFPVTCIKGYFTYSNREENKTFHVRCRRTKKLKKLQAWQMAESCPDYTFNAQISILVKNKGMVRDMLVAYPEILCGEKEQ